MKKTTFSKSKNKEKEQILVNGRGLFSKEEVTVSISKAEKNSGIFFVLNNEKIKADIANVSYANRNTVLTKGKETICLVEHFLAACSVLGIDDIEVVTDKNELVFNDGSAMHWYESLLNSSFIKVISESYELKEAVFVRKDNKEIIAIPHHGFKVSYLMDWDHPSLGKLWASWQPSDDPIKILRARTFARQEENDFFGMSDRLLTLTNNGFNKKLCEPLEPVYHKILDIIGDLRLCGINPLKINMHVIGVKSGHSLNIELAKELRNFI